MTTPPEHALPLLEAFQRWTDPALLAEIGEGWLPDCYRPRYGGAAFKATGGFVERLGRRELILWARQGTPLGPWVETPASAWPEPLRVRNWRRGIIGCVHHKSGLVERSRLVTDPDPICGRIVIRSERRTVPGQVEEWTYWYDARVALAADLVVSPSEPAVRSAARARQSEVNAWYERERVEPFRNTRVPSREADWRAAQAYFGDRVTQTMTYQARDELQRKRTRGRPPKIRVE